MKNTILSFLVLLTSVIYSQTDTVCNPSFEDSLNNWGNFCNGSSIGSFMIDSGAAYSGNLGLKINKPQKLSNLMEYFFGEDQGRYLIEVEKNNLDFVKKNLKESNIFYEEIATVQKEIIEIPGELKIKLKDLYISNNKWYNNY